MCVCVLRCTSSITGVLVDCVPKCLLVILLLKCGQCSMKIFPSSVWQDALTGWRRVLDAAVAATDFRLVFAIVFRILSLLPSCGVSEYRFVRTGVLLVLSLSCLVQL